MAGKNPPTAETVIAQLDRILQSSDFKASDKQRRFLQFIIEETLAGRSDAIKGYTIATMVYNRSADFDPQVDPIVRVEAGRLRRSLERYYLTAGRRDALRIEIPKGGYIPTFQSTPPPPSDVTSADGPAIAVIPLVNLSGDIEQDYFSNGITEELTAELSRYQEFTVIAYQSAMRFKGLDNNPEDVGRNLGVRFLLTGSVRKDTESMKVIIQLLDTTKKIHIWSGSFKRHLTAANIISMQEEIAQRVVGAIADQFGQITSALSADARKKAPHNLSAYDATLRFYHYETVLTPESFGEAMTALERAVDTDPEYGLAWAMLGHLHADNYALGFCDIDAPLDKALTCAQKGVALAPQEQFTHDALTLAHFHRGEKLPFLKHLEATLALNPNAPYIVGVAGWHLMLFGEWERGRGLLEQGMRLNPYHPTWFHLAPFMDFYCHGDHEHALAEAYKFNYPGLFWDPLLRAAALARLGRHAEAATAAGDLQALVPDFTEKGRQMIGFYVKNDELIDAVIEGLQMAGVEIET